MPFTLFIQKHAGQEKMIQFEICLLRMAIRDQVYMFLYDVAFKAPYIN